MRYVPLHPITRVFVPVGTLLNRFFRNATFCQLKTICLYSLLSLLRSPATPTWPWGESALPSLLDCCPVVRGLMPLSTLRCPSVRCRTRMHQSLQRDVTRGGPGGCGYDRPRCGNS
ncbi:hypothetical protein DPEC_G00185590 [Dallia pectoralis]|uniref:Uncharacterized protein n=1 Tax=Dallia pectoralis TaxID=75939 RepID=A0ACC2GBW3_DALPE|nr:hypothetical protein DPEC_G00185590 [Dallia pectoralis]